MQEDFNDESKEAEREIISFVTSHCESWRDYRDTNFLDKWLEYERIFRGQWDAGDKMRESERSRIISPATQQAIETRHAEIMEAIFGSGTFFDIEDDVKDVNGDPLDVEAIKLQLHEDFKKDKIKKSVDQIELMAEIYGTGIGEILVKEKDEYKPQTKEIPGMSGVAAIGVESTKRTCVTLKPVNPKNFLIDPNAETIDEALGVAIEKYVSLHSIVQGIESGKYRKVSVNSLHDDDDLEPTQETTQYQEDKVKLITYYGLVPKSELQELLTGEEAEGEEEVDLFGDSEEASKYEGLVEAIIIIANDSVLLKAEENPYMMNDRPVIAYQDDTVPGRFWGRGTAEKAYNMQKAIDGNLRMDMDSRALTSAPMLAMDATRLPRGAKFEIKPGKALLTNGNPSEIMMPFKFGETSVDITAAAQNYERMLLQATGTVDSAGMPSNVPRDAGVNGMSMAMAGIIKKYKRTLSNFQEDFLIPFINKAVWRYMQYDPERYPSTDLVFTVSGSLGILAREFEQQQMIGLLQTLGPDTPVLPILLKGIIGNSSLSNRAELLQALSQMSQPNPEQQQAQQMQMQAQMATVQAQLAELQAKSQKLMAEAQQIQVETQYYPQEIQAKLAAALSNNLEAGVDDDKEFERSARIADLMLKEKEVSLKERDIDSNERITMAQMQAKQRESSEFQSVMKDTSNE